MGGVNAVEDNANIFHTTKCQRTILVEVWRRGKVEGWEEDLWKWRVDGWKVDWLVGGKKEDEEDLVDGKEDVGGGRMDWRGLWGGGLVFRGRRRSREEGVGGGGVGGKAEEVGADLLGGEAWKLEGGGLWGGMWIPGGWRDKRRRGEGRMGAMWGRYGGGLGWGWRGGRLGGKGGFWGGWRLEGEGMDWRNGWKLDVGEWRKEWGVDLGR
ncbi:hypothetical protein Tco_0396605 [Tanacetum coccineum]